MPWHQNGGAIGAGGNQQNLDETNWLGTRNAAPLRIITENGGGLNNDVPNQAAEVMRITAAADGRRVAIGTPTPRAKLTVAGGGATINGVAVGTDVPGVIDYPLEYETVGVTQTNYNLRLQSPNAIVFHTGDTLPDPTRYRMLLSGDGDLYIRKFPPNDTTPSNARLTLTNRGAGGTEVSWSLYTAAVGGGFGVNPNAFEIWEYPATRTRFQIRRGGDTYLAPAGGNVLLPNASAGTDGNLYFGGTTDTGQIGMRLFGGTVNPADHAGFIDVRTDNVDDGLRIRVDTNIGATERMRVTATGSVGIGTPRPQTWLHVRGNRIRIEDDTGTGRSLDLRADGAALDLQSNGGDLFINNNTPQQMGFPVRIPNLVAPSSRNLKENMVAFTAQEAIKALEGLKPSFFNWKGEKEKTRHLGFVAEDTPEIATTHDKTAVIPMHILSILSKVVQEQQRTINAMRRALGLQDAM